MAERPRAATTAGITRSRSGASTGARRNLFQSQLTRRPTANSSTTSGSETMRLDVGVLDDAAPIVVRDKHGEIELGDPPVPILDEEDEMAAEQSQETEKERQRLTETVKSYQLNHGKVSEQPEELLEAVRASLRAKVAALAEDNWMYEKEEPPRG